MDIRYIMGGASGFLFSPIIAYLMFGIYFEN